jgi:hypothetical protein
MCAEAGPRAHQDCGRKVGVGHWVAFAEAWVFASMPITILCVQSNDSDAQRKGFNHLILLPIDNHLYYRYNMESAFRKALSIPFLTLLCFENQSMDEMTSLKKLDHSK